MSDLLFYGVGIFDAMEHQKEALRQAARTLSEQEIVGHEQQVIDELVERFGINVPVLQEDKIEATQCDVQIDVSGDPNRLFWDPSQPFYLPGTEMTIHVPFTGDEALFGVQPQTFNLNPPRGRVVGNELQLVFKFLQGQGDVKRQYEDILGRIKQHLEWLRPSAGQLQGQLKQLAEAEIRQRKQQFEQRKAAVASLGIPMRQHVGKEARSESVFEKPVTAPQPGSRKRAAEEWDVFVSHASEDKEAIAKALAETLRRAGFKVWYDEFSLSLGDSLRESIDRGLARSRYGVVILSKAFFEKHWPAKELNGLTTREIDGRKVILPIWHGVTFEEVRNYSPVLADRLAISTDRGLDCVVEEIIKILRIEK